MKRDERLLDEPHTHITELSTHDSARARLMRRLSSMTQAMSSAYGTSESTPKAQHLLLQRWELQFVSKDMAFAGPRSRRHPSMNSYVAQHLLMMHSREFTNWLTNGTVAATGLANRTAKSVLSCPTLRLFRFLGHGQLQHFRCAC